MAKGYRGLQKGHYLLKQLSAGGDYHIIVNKANNDKIYWLGIRDNKVMLYYMGGKILEIGEKGDLSFDAHYLAGDTSYTIGSRFKTIGDWLENENILIDAISDFQKSGHNEKIAQQKIMIGNNSSDAAEWFLVDMEYSVPGVSYGRFDMIAVSKEKDESGRHKIALIELKSGTGAFSGARAERNNNNDIIGLKSYGSGIAGHINNFYEYLHGQNAQNNLNNLAKEIAMIINNYNEIGITTPFSGFNAANINTDTKSVECVIMCVNIKKKEKEYAYKKCRRFIFENEEKQSKLCLESKYCWDKAFISKFGKLNLYFSAVDKKRVIKRSDFIQIQREK